MKGRGFVIAMALAVVLAAQAARAQSADKGSETATTEDTVAVSKDWVKSNWSRIGKLTRTQRSFKVQQTRTVAGVRGAERQDPVLDQLYYPGGEARLSRASLQESIQLLREAIGKNPQDKKVPEMMYFIGQCHVQLGEVDKALEVYTQISKEHPKSKWSKRAKEEADRLKAQQGQAQ